MSVLVDIISVGTLSRNRFWNEQRPMRNAHATTTLLRDAEVTAIVDPSLPSEALAQRLDDRTGLKPEMVELVFLTNFRPIHRRALSLFPNATWLMSAEEIEAMALFLNEVLASAESKNEQPDEMVEQELALLGRIQPAPEKISSSVHLFPTAGVTPGACSLLALGHSRTIAVAGDAIIDRDYFCNDQTFELSSDVAAAKRSFAELAEIADVIVPGHGDWVINF